MFFCHVCLHVFCCDIKINSFQCNKLSNTNKFLLVVLKMCKICIMHDDMSYPIRFVDLLAVDMKSNNLYQS